jgi:membrane protein YdbS with pleckstrin-like domain
MLLGQTLEETSPTTTERLLLSVRPVFVRWVALATLLPYLLFFPVWAAIFFGSIIAQLRGLSGPSWSGVLVPGSLAFLVVLVLGYVGKKLSYDRTQYNFYPDHLEFDVGFFATSRKVIPYRDIKEVSLREGFLQRLCDLGTIYLGSLTTGTIPSSNPFTSLGWTDASASGAALRDIPEPDVTFEKIRRLITPDEASTPTSEART